MKKLSVLLMIGLLLVSAAPAYAAEQTDTMTDPGTSAINLPNDGTADPLAVITKEVTVIKWYPSWESIPSTVPYEEYDARLLTWYTGTLFLQKAERQGAGWKATFVGEVSAPGL